MSQAYRHYVVATSEEEAMSSAEYGSFHTLDDARLCVRGFASCDPSRPRKIYLAEIKPITVLSVVEVQP